MESSGKIIEIAVEKLEGEVSGVVNSQSIKALIDIAFKDMCIELRSVDHLFGSYCANGCCNLSVYAENLFELNIENLSKEEIIKKFEFFSMNILKNEIYFRRSPAIYRNIQKVQKEVTDVYNSIKNLSKKEMFERYDRELDFYDKELSINLFPSHKVKISQNGFSYEEVKDVIAGIYNQISKSQIMFYKVDFKALTFV